MRATLLLLLPIACGPRPPAPPRLTDEVTRVATHGRTVETRSSAVPGVRRALLAEGYGDEVEAAGEPHVALGGPGRAPGGRRIARFVHLADLQLGDDESPGRTAAVDQPGATNAAYRPHDAYLCLMTDAMVRQIVALEPDFVLLGGDNIDSAQSNELSWVMTLLDGGRVHCDSGRDDTLDPKNAFDAHGLGGIPWLWVTGNHDVLVQGNFVVDDAKRAEAIGTLAVLGTRDWSLPGGPVVQGDVPADAERALLSPVELLSRVVGHGPQAGATLANYTWDVEGTPLRLVVLDTAARSGGSEGVLKRDVLDGFLAPALEQAATDGKWVIVAAHHAASALTDGDQPFGTRQPDAVTKAEYVALLTRYPNVVLSLAAHSHRHEVRTLDGANPVVEMTTASLADFPFQARRLDVFEEDGGWLRIRATSIDVPADSTLLEEARRLAVMDWTTGWFDAAPTLPGDRNVDVWVKRPPGT